MDILYLIHLPLRLDLIFFFVSVTSSEDSIIPYRLIPVIYGESEK